MRDGSQPPVEYAGLLYLKTSHVKSYCTSIHSLLSYYVIMDQYGFPLKVIRGAQMDRNIFFEMIKLMQPMPTAIKAVAWLVIQRNA